MPIPESAASENQSERPLLKRLCFSYLLRIFRRKNRNFTVFGKLSHIYLKQIEKNVEMPLTVAGGNDTISAVVSECNFSKEICMT